MHSRTVLLLLLCGTAQILLCTSAPKLQRQSPGNCTSRIEEANEFDLGPVDTCERPPTNFCHSVDYAVPTSIVNLTAILEKEIEADYLDHISQGSEECANALREITCALRFPRCSEDRQNVTLGADLLDNCTKILSVCLNSESDKSRLAGFCNLSGTYPLGDSVSGATDTCTPVTSYNYSFQNCPVSSQWSVTQWMYELLVYTDMRVSRESPGLESYHACWPNYVKYMCQRIGRCWSAHNGTTRVEAINTVTSCEDTINW